VVAFFASVPGAEGRSMGVLLRALLASGAAVAVYGALFAFLGLALRKPLVIGLLVLFGWEGLVHGPGLLPRVTLTAHLRALAGSVNAVPELTPGAAGLILIAFVVVLLSASLVVFKYGEWVPES
jgi:hypothetical protein